MNIRSVTQVSVTGSSATSAALTVGFKYLISSSTDCYILQGGSGVTAATNTGFFLKSGAMVDIFPTGADDKYVAAIQASANGTLTIARMEGE